MSTRQRTVFILLQVGLADPADPHEAVMNVQAAEELGVHIGSVIGFGLNSNAQERLINFSERSLEPASGQSRQHQVGGNRRFPPRCRRGPVRRVGISGGARNPRAHAVRSLHVVPTTPTAPCNSRVAPSDDGKVVSEITTSGIVPRGVISAVGFMTDTPAIASADRAIKPEAIALAVFGGLAGLAAIIIACQVISRQLRLRADEFNTSYVPSAPVPQ